MANENLREVMKTQKIFIWEVAERLGIHETTLVKKFRKELPEEQAKQIFSIIEEIHLEKVKAGE